MDGSNWNKTNLPNAFGDAVELTKANGGKGTHFLIQVTNITEGVDSVITVESIVFDFN